MTYVEGRFASPLAKRRALVVLAIIAVWSFLSGMFRDVEFRWPSSQTTAAPQPQAPPVTPPAPIAQTIEPVEAEDEAPEKAPEPKAEAPRSTEDVAVPELTLPPPPVVQPAPLTPPPTPTQAPATPEDPPI